VQLHAGQIEVEDRPGGGARFVVTLPVGVDEPSPALLSAGSHGGAVLKAS
jgi:hypothetical protein